MPPVNPPTIEKPAEEPAAVAEPEPETGERQGFFGRMWERLAGRVADLMSEPDYDSEDDSE